jgi:hypothetical protein
MSLILPSTMSLQCVPEGESHDVPLGVYALSSPEIQLSICCPDGTRFSISVCADVFVGQLKSAVKKVLKQATAPPLPRPDVLSVTVPRHIIWHYRVLPARPRGAVTIFPRASRARNLRSNHSLHATTPRYGSCIDASVLCPPRAPPPLPDTEPTPSVSNCETPSVSHAATPLPP